MIAHIFLIFNFGGGEIFLILMAFILLFGAKRIPEVARTLGKGMREIRNATSDIQREIKDATGDPASLSRQMEEKIKQQARDIEGAIARNTPKAKSENPPQPDKPEKEQADHHTERSDPTVTREKGKDSASEQQGSSKDQKDSSESNMTKD